MLKCPLYNENMIASYVEGLLDEDESKIFERHLMSCDICLKSVLDLRNDLNKMDLYEKRIYKGLYLIEAVFMLFKNRLVMLRDIGYDFHFEKLKSHLNLRGKNNYDYYRVEIENVSIGVSRESKSKFLIEFKNIKGKNIELFKDNRLIEAHVNPNRDDLSINGLDRGEYTIVIYGDKREEYGRIKIRVN